MLINSELIFMLDYLHKTITDAVININMGITEQFPGDRAKKYRVKNQHPKT
jgi:hypothetical protein